MRRWLIVAGVALALAVVVVAVALDRLGRALDANRHWIEARAEAVLGRPVRFEAMGVSLRGGLGVRVTALRIAEDPRWADGDFLRADAVQVTVRLWPALRGRFQVRRVRLERPAITLVRTAAGWNVDSLARPPEASGRALERSHAPRPAGLLAAARPRPERSARPGWAVRPASAAAAETGALERAAAISVSRFDVRDGTLRVLDRTRAAPLELVLSHVDVQASHLGLRNAADLAIEAALFDGDAGRVWMQGVLGPLGVPPALDAVPLDVRFGADEIALAVLRRALPDLVPAGPDDALPLGLRVRLAGTTASAAVEARATAGALAVEATGTVERTPALRADLVVAVPRVRLTELGALVPALRGDGVAGTVEARLRMHGALDVGVPPALDGTVAFVDAAFGEDGPGGITTTVRIAGDTVEIPPTRVEIDDAGVQVALRARRDGAAVAMDRLTVEGFGGTVEADGRILLDDPVAPRFAVRGTARDLSLGRIVASRRPDLAERLEGRLAGDFEVSGAGRSAAAVRRSLAGGMRVRATDVVVRGFNVAESILEGLTGGVRGLVNLVPERLRSRRPELFGQETRIQELRAVTRLAGPLARVDEAVAIARAWSLRAAGTVELAGPLDLRGTFTADRSLTDEIVDAVHEARWVVGANGLLAVPFRLTGTPPDLRTVPDPGFVTKTLQRALLERGLELPRQRREGRERDRRAGDETQDLIRRGLDRLFGR